MSISLRTKWLWVQIPLLSLKLQIRGLLQARSSLTFRKTIERGLTLKLLSDKIITYSQMHHTDKYSQQLNHLASLAKWPSVRLWTKWLWIRILLLSLKLQIWCLFSARSSLTFRHTLESRFTLKLVCDMIITYSQIHRTDKYSQQFNHLASFAKWLSVRLRTKWLWVRIPFLS